MALGDVYFSADVEADGPIPGPYSMLAVGLAVAGHYDDAAFTAHDPAAATFYRELKPISETSDAAALSVSGLDRELLVREGVDPVAAMRDLATWVRIQSDGARPVMVGYPLVFDWMFIHWYFIHFLGESPFGHAGALDIKTIYQQKARVTIALAGRRDLPQELRPSRRHTHNALQDAMEQAEILQRLIGWQGAGR